MSDFRYTVNEDGIQRPKPRSIEPFEQFPLEALPEPVKSFVQEGAAAIGCDPSYLVLPLLSALGAAIGNSRRLFVKRSWLVPAIVWTAIVGESGTAKTPAFQLVMQFVRRRQTDMLENHKKLEEEYQELCDNYELDHADWKKNRRKKPSVPKPEKPEPPTCERVVVNDTTVEGLVPVLQANPRGVLVERDELAGWLGSFDKYASKGQSDSSHWLSMFNAQPINVDRKTSGYVHVPAGYVCVTGGIQPRILAKVLTDEQKDSGMAARILMALPPRIAKTWTEAEISEKIESALESVFEQLYALEPETDEDGRSTPKELGMNTAAKEVWIKYYNEHNAEQVKTTGELSAAYSKLEEYPLRFAQIFHLVKQATGGTTGNAVDVESVQAGIDLANWFKRETERVYATLRESTEMLEARDLVTWIASKGGAITARQLQQGRRAVSSSEDANNLLQELVAKGFGDWEHTPRGQKGQPTRKFVLQPAYLSTVYGTPLKPEENNNTVDSRRTAPLAITSVTVEGEL